MSDTTLLNKYYVRRSMSAGTWEDVGTKFAGCRILSLTGFNAVGDSINIYNEQWITGEEDFQVVETDGQGNPVVRRKNVDLDLTFVISRRYASSAIDEQTVYDSVVDYICNHGDFYIKSAYVNKSAHVVCLGGFEPTTQSLKRGNNSYILGSIRLHTLETPSNASSPTYTPESTSQSGYQSKNPKALGWYERDGSTTAYRPTWDTSPVSGKTYYSIS